MKKNLIITATCGLLAAVFTAGATMAYFTNSKTADNVVTMGDVSINLLDTLKDPGNVTPNGNIDKSVQVQNTGNNAAYIRVKLNRHWTDKDSKEQDLNKNFIEIPSYDKDNWYYDANSDTYYFKNPVPSKGYTTVLFTSVHISDKANNAYAGKLGKIDVTAEAVQADNFTPVKNDGGFITGWNDVTIETTPTAV